MQTVLTAKANSIWQQELNKNIIKKFSLPTSTCRVVQWANFPAFLPLFLAANHKNVTVSIFFPLDVFFLLVPYHSFPGDWCQLVAICILCRCLWDGREIKQKMHNTGDIQQSSTRLVIQGLEQEGLVVSTFSFSAYSLNVFANTSHYLCRYFAGY